MTAIVVAAVLEEEHMAFLDQQHSGKEGQAVVVVDDLLSQPTLLQASKARLTGASSKGGKCAESPPTFICGRHRKNRRKPVMKNISDSGVVFTFE